MKVLNKIIFIYVLVVAAYVFTSDAHARSMTVPVMEVYPIEINEARMVKQDYCRPVVTGYNDGMRGTTGGAIVGALLGSMVGKTDSQRRIGTAIGAVMGARAGTRYNTAPGHTTRNHCDYTYTNQLQRVIQGYKVTYRHNGQLYTTEMDHDPGQYVTKCPSPNTCILNSKKP